MTIDEALSALIRDNADKFQQARDKPQLRGWFIGQIMKMTDGKYKRYIVADVVVERFHCDI